MRKLPVGEDGGAIVSDDDEEATEWKVAADDTELRSKVEDVREVEGVE